MTIHYYDRAQCGEPTDFAEPPDAPPTVFVRARGAGTFHLARVPRDAALCGQPRPRAGWWDVYQELDWPEAMCLGCTNAAAQGEGAG